MDLTVFYAPHLLDSGEEDAGSGFAAAPPHRELLSRDSQEHVSFRAAALHSVDYEGFGTPKSAGYVTKMETHQALKLIVWRQVDF